MNMAGTVVPTSEDAEVEIDKGSHRYEPGREESGPIDVEPDVVAVVPQVCHVKVDPAVEVDIAVARCRVDHCHVEWVSPAGVPDQFGLKELGDVERNRQKQNRHDVAV